MLRWRRSVEETRGSSAVHQIRKCKQKQHDIKYAEMSSNKPCEVGERKESQDPSL